MLLNVVCSSSTPKLYKSLNVIDDQIELVDTGIHLLFSTFSRAKTYTLADQDDGDLFLFSQRDEELVVR